VWLRHEHDVTLILRRLQRLNPLPFFDDLERKLVEPFENLGIAGSPEARLVFDRLHAVLRRPEAYVDFALLARKLPRLPFSVDVQACLRYEKLLARVLGDEVAGRRRDELVTAFDRHRSRYAPEDATN
jgi:hypothetical protein